METRPAPVSQPLAGEPPRAERPDWQPSPGLIERMLAYRDWWNIPARRARATAGKGRPRAQDRSRREA